MKDEKVLVFEPQGVGYFKKSPLYAASMFSKIIALSSRYLVEALRGRADLATTDKYIDVFWRLQFQTCFTRLYVEGLSHLNPHDTYIFMSNHESWFDIPAMFGAVPHSLRMVSKAGLMKVPIFGHAMTKAGFIAVDRNDRSRAIRQLDAAKERLLDGISVWIAPEGTRSRDGQIAHFKKGGFYVAKSLKKPIVPVFIEGAAKVMPADSLSIVPNQSITVHFCKPISSELVESLSTKDLVDMVRDVIIAKKEECLNIRGEKNASS